MVKRKSIRERGKISLSRYFQKLNSGDSVAVVKEMFLASTFPQRLQGRTGKIIEKRGKSYVIKIMDHNKEKTFIIEPVHLRKISIPAGSKIK